LSGTFKARDVGADDMAVVRRQTSRRFLCLIAVLGASWAMAAPAGARVDPQVAGLQVALRAYSFYGGAIDGIFGPATRRGVKGFQRRVGLNVDGRAGKATRRAFGPLGNPAFGTRTIRRGSVGWDVSILQFLLERRGAFVPISGYFDTRTARAVLDFQRTSGLAEDSIAGSATLDALRSRAPHTAKPVPVRETSSSRVPALLDYWAAHYGVDRHLVHAVAWMESGFQTDLTSPAGAWGVMQILPGTWTYVETVLIGSKIPRTASGNIRVGVAYLRQLLREFNGNRKLALAAWYQGPTSVRKRGALPETKIFVANVLALRRSSLA
jgi:peptidoglycan hydrolase-like protein with peptidoglycan-binding domain